MDFLGSVVSDCIQPLYTPLSTKLSAFFTRDELIVPSIAKIFNRRKINKLLAFYLTIAGFFGLPVFSGYAYRGNPVALKSLVNSLYLAIGYKFSKGNGTFWLWRMWLVVGLPSQILLKEKEIDSRDPLPAKIAPDLPDSASRLINRSVVGNLTDDSSSLIYPAVGANFTDDPASGIDSSPVVDSTYSPALRVYISIVSEFSHRSATDIESPVIADFPDFPAGVVEALCV